MSYMWSSEEKKNQSLLQELIFFSLLAREFPRVSEFGAPVKKWRRSGAERLNVESLRAEGTAVECRGGDLTRRECLW